MPRAASNDAGEARPGGSFGSRLLRGLSILALVSGALAVLAGALGTPFLVRDAVMAQRVLVDQTAGDLFGGGEPALTPVGSPMRYVVNDPKAFLPQTGPRGLRYLDEAYLKSSGRYPLQAQTLEWAGTTLAQSGGVVLALGALGTWLSRRRSGPASPAG